MHEHLTGGFASRIYFTSNGRNKIVENRNFRISVKYWWNKSRYILQFSLYILFAWSVSNFIMLKILLKLESTYFRTGHPKNLPITFGGLAQWRATYTCHEPRNLLFINILSHEAHPPLCQTACCWQCLPSHELFQQWYFFGQVPVIVQERAPARSQIIASAIFWLCGCQCGVCKWFVRGNTTLTT